MRDKAAAAAAVAAAAAKSCTTYPCRVYPVLEACRLRRRILRPADTSRYGHQKTHALFVQRRRTRRVKVSALGADTWMLVTVPLLSLLLLLLLLLYERRRSPAATAVGSKPALITMNVLYQETYLAVQFTQAVIEKVWCGALFSCSTQPSTHANVRPKYFAPITQHIMASLPPTLPYRLTRHAATTPGQVARGKGAWVRQMCDRDF